MALLFESEICGRCGGSGQYSFNQVDGTRCYGCMGAKYRLTKRGAAAQRYFRELMERTVEQLKVGDIVKGTGVTMNCRLYGFKGTILEIDLEPQVFSWQIVKDPEAEGGERRIPQPQVSYTTSRGKHWLQLGTKVEIANPDERKIAAEKALAYQATLTKAGTPMKRKAVA